MARMPPSKEYLFREAQPAMNTAKVFNPVMAKKKITAPSSMNAFTEFCSPLSQGNSSGKKQSTSIAGISERIGARR